MGKEKKAARAAAGPSSDTISINTKCNNCRQAFNSIGDYVSGGIKKVNGIYVYTCENGCKKTGCSSCTSERFMTCRVCSKTSCGSCSSHGSSPPSLPLDSDAPRKKFMQFFNCSDCDFSICERCYLSQKKNNIIPCAMCTRCFKVICAGCKPPAMSKCEQLLPGCYACNNTFCLDCIQQNTIVCYKKNCHCEIPCVCDVVCIDCRTDRCRRCSSTLSRQEQMSLRLRKKALNRARMLEAGARERDDVVGTSEQSKLSAQVIKANMLMEQLIAEETRTKESSKNKKKAKKKKSLKTPGPATQPRGSASQKPSADKEQDDSDEEDEEDEAAAPGLGLEEEDDEDPFEELPDLMVSDESGSELDDEETSSSLLKLENELQLAMEARSADRVQHLINVASPQGVQTITAQKLLKRLRKASSLRDDLLNAIKEDKGPVLSETIAGLEQLPPRITSLLAAEMNEAKYLLGVIERNTSLQQRLGHPTTDARDLDDSAVNAATPLNGTSGDDEPINGINKHVSPPSRIPASRPGLSNDIPQCDSQSSNTVALYGQSFYSHDMGEEEEEDEGDDSVSQKGDPHSDLPRNSNDGPSEVSTPLSSTSSMLNPSMSYSEVLNAKHSSQPTPSSPGSGSGINLNGNNAPQVPAKPISHEVAPGAGTNIPLDGSHNFALPWGGNFPTLPQLDPSFIPEVAPLSSQSLFNNATPLPSGTSSPMHGKIGRPSSSSSNPGVLSPERLDLPSNPSTTTATPSTNPTINPFFNGAQFGIFNNRPLPGSDQALTTMPSLHEVGKPDVSQPTPGFDLFNNIFGINTQPNFEYSSFGSFLPASHSNGDGSNFFPNVGVPGPNHSATLTNGVSVAPIRPPNPRHVSASITNDMHDVNNGFGNVQRSVSEPRGFFSPPDASRPFPLEHEPSFEYDHHFASLLAACGIDSGDGGWGDHNGSETTRAP